MSTTRPGIPLTAQREDQRPGLRETEFWQELMEDVYGPRQGGAIVVFDSQDARKGTGKTTAALTVAKAVSREFGWELTEDDLLLSGEAYLRRLQEHPGKEQPSAVVWDEAVGAGSGDGRRAMSEQNRVMGQAWQTLRMKRIVHCVTLPDWNFLDVRLQKLADFRAQCLTKPIGAFRTYRIGTPFEGGGVRTPALGPNDSARRILFPNLDAHDDELYQYLASRKQSLIDADEGYDADEVLTSSGGEEGADQDPEKAAEAAERRAAIKTVIRAVKPWDDDDGLSYRAAARLTDYSTTWVANRVDDWEAGEYRDLVEEGEALTA